MIRTYAVDGTIVHDPAAGLTYRAPEPQPTGRLRLDERIVDSWPVLTPADPGRAMPVSLCWSPIVRCNLHCPHCLDDTSVPEQDAAHRARIAGILATAGVLGVDISGGEPLLLRDLPALGERITAGGRTAVSVTTNGWHLQRRAEELAGAVDAIRVSLDGADANQHDAIRGPDSFTRATAGITAAVTVGLPVQIQTVLMASIRDGAQRMVDLAVQLGVGGVTFLQMLPIGTGQRLPTEMLTDAQALAITAELQVPDGLRVRLRTRASAGGFTVVRADGRVWRNDPHALRIGGVRPLTQAADLAVVHPDGTP